MALENYGKCPDTDSNFKNIHTHYLTHLLFSVQQVQTKDSN